LPLFASGKKAGAVEFIVSLREFRREVFRDVGAEIFSVGEADAMVAHVAKIIGAERFDDCGDCRKMPMLQRRKLPSVFSVRRALG